MVLHMCYNPDTAVSRMYVQNVRFALCLMELRQ